MTAYSSLFPGTVLVPDDLLYPNAADIPGGGGGGSTTPAICLIYPDTLLSPGELVYPGGVECPGSTAGGGGDWVTFRDPFKAWPYQKRRRRKEMLV